jgi:nanoRNase/pAp phosphatase (c-di-AMP/oligoRNAs hydrolase)
MDLLERIKAKKTLVLLHHNADPDAVGSAAALKEVIPLLDIACFASVSNAGKRLASHLGIDISTEPVLEDYEQFVVLDTSTPVQLGELAPGVKKPIVIDHHTSSGLWDAEIEMIEPEASSTAEIIYDIFESAGIDITKEIGVALLAGIISDTGRFRFASSKAFSTVSKILDCTGLSVEEVITLLEDEDYFNYSKRIAQLKAANRMNFTTVGEIVIVTSHVGSYEAAAARILMITGGDIVFVSNNKKKDLRISARAKPHIVDMGVNLGEFLGEMGEELGCQGGGHAGAAGLNGKGDPETAINTLVKGIEKLLKELGHTSGE